MASLYILMRSDPSLPIYLLIFADANSGVHLHFWSGNEVYWKVRWEASAVDGATMRTMVVYKEMLLQSRKLCFGYQMV